MREGVKGVGPFKMDFLACKEGKAGDIKHEDTCGQALDVDCKGRGTLCLCSGLKNGDKAGLVFVSVSFGDRLRGAQVHFPCHVPQERGKPQQPRSMDP